MLCAGFAPGLQSGTRRPTTASHHQCMANPLGTASEEHAMRQDDGHHAFVFQEVEAMQQEGKVGGGFRSQSIVLEANVVAHRVGRVPAVAEGRIGDDGVEAGFLRWVQLAQGVPLVGQGVAVEDFELRVLHPVQQHVHAGQVVGGDVLFLAVDLADALRPHAFAHVQQQGAGAAGKVQHAFQPLLRAGLRFLAVQRDDGGEDVGYLLRGVELARLLARPGGKLAD